MKKLLAVLAVLGLVTSSVPAFADKGGVPNENASDNAKGNTGTNNGATGIGKDGTPPGQVDDGTPASDNAPGHNK